MLGRGGLRLPQAEDDVPAARFTMGPPASPHPGRSRIALRRTSCRLDQLPRQLGTKPKQPCTSPACQGCHVLAADARAVACGR